MLSKIYQTLFPNETPEKQKILSWGALLLVVIIAIISVFAPWEITTSVLVVILALLLFFRFINFGFYFVVLLYPFIYLQLFIGKEINVPYVDLVAMFVFAAWALRSLLLPPYGGLNFLKQWGR